MLPRNPHRYLGGDEHGPAGGRWEIGRSTVAVMVSLVGFAVASLLAFLAARLLFDGILLPAAIGVFCGLAVATVLNATDVLARRTRREPGGDGPEHVARRNDDRAP